MKTLTTLFLAFVISLQSSAQSCEQSPGFISAYYSQSAKGFGIGVEAGLMSEFSPFGAMIGCNYVLYNNKTIEKFSGEEISSSNFYLKGSLRVLRIESRMHAFLIASPQLSIESGFDLNSGAKLLFPLSERLAFQIEPLYSLKQRSYMVNFHLSLAL
jgi:hypothetical protein